MARTVAEIQAEIIGDIANNSNLNYTDNNNITRNITYNTSKRAIWRAWTYVFAVAISVLEQLQDLYLTNVEAQVAKSAAASALWIQGKMFAFQYDATTPQIVQLINTVPQYPVVDDTKKIITGCAVSVDLTNTVNIKVAKGNPFVKLVTAEITAAQSYITTIGVAGINYNVISLDADKLYIEAQVYYNGMYSATIQVQVVTALNDYLQNLSQTNFNGSIQVSDIEGVIRNVTGVNDVVLNNVVSRPDAVGYGGGTQLVLNNTLLQKGLIANGGYWVGETTTGHTFNDTLTFIAQ
jgi:hypothetical protein